MIPVGYEQNMEHICSRDIRENPKPQLATAFSRPYHFMEGKKIMDALKGRYSEPCVLIKALVELERMSKNAVGLHNAVNEPGLFLQVIHLIATHKSEEVIYHCYRVLYFALGIRPDLLSELGCLEAVIECVIKLAAPFEPFFVFNTLQMSYTAFLYGNDIPVPLDSPRGIQLVETAIRWLARIQEHGYDSLDNTRRPFDSVIAIYKFLNEAFKISRVVVDSIEDEFEERKKPSIISCIFRSRKGHEVEIIEALRVLLQLCCHNIFLDALEIRVDICNPSTVLEILHHPNYTVQSLTLKFIESAARHVGCCYNLLGTEDGTPADDLIKRIRDCTKSGDVNVQEDALATINALTAIGPMLTKGHKFKEPLKEKNRDEEDTNETKNPVEMK